MKAKADKDPDAPGSDWLQIAASADPKPGSGMFIPDPGSEFFDPGSRIRMKEFKYF